MKATVIIPAYIPTPKHGSLLQRAITSLEAQTHKNFDTICVLNGCYTDYEEIKSFIKTNLHIEYISIQGKASGAIARNFGVKNSKTELITWLDADDQYHIDKLKKQIDFFSNNTDYDFVGTLAMDCYPDGRLEASCHKAENCQTHEQIFLALQKENVMCHGSVMFKKSSFERLKGYNEKNKPGSIWPEYDRAMWEDWDLWIRALKSGMRFYNLPERLYYWSVGTSVDR
jgi:glycosyltransferase involved in cell wall biosynthesis